MIETSRRQEITVMWSKYHADKAAYDAELKKWEAQFNLHHNTHLAHIVNLNVGGQHISVSIAQLTSVKGSKLEMMFRDTYTHSLLPRDNNGRIYFDRDPKQFSHLLNFIANDGQFNTVQDTFEN